MKKAKFNVVDLLVLLVLVAGVAFVGLRMFGGSQSSSGDAPVTGGTYRVTFQADCVNQAVTDTLVLNSKSENASRNMDLGTLVDFFTEASVVYSYNSDGISVRSARDGYVKVTLVCELTGIQQPTGLQVGQYMLNIGHNMGVRCGNTEINCNVMDIQPVE